MNKPFTDIDNWHEARWGNFTCSLNDKLVDNNGAKAPFTPGGYSYIKQKAVECCIRMEERPEMEEFKNFLWGKVYELPAFEAYVQATNNKLYLDYEPLKDDSGGSPDVINITPSFTVDFVAEIKCPKNPAIHFERLKWTNQWDIKENLRETYTQIQNLMMITGAKDADFISYDGRMLSKRHQVKIISVKADKKFQDNLHYRLISAIEHKYKVISQYLEVDVKNKQQLKQLALR